MRFSMRDLRPAHLLGAWATYWAGLVAVKLGPGIAAVTKMQAPGAKGSATVSLDNDHLTAKVFEGTRLAWEATSSVTTVALWVVVPPLVIWGIWMATRPARTSESLRDELPLSGSALPLGEGAAEPIRHARGAERHPVARPITPDPARSDPRR